MCEYWRRCDIVAGSLVFDSVPPFAIVIGVPAKLIIYINGQKIISKSTTQY